MFSVRSVVESLMHIYLDVSSVTEKSQKPATHILNGVVPDCRDLPCVNTIKLISIYQAQAVSVRSTRALYIHSLHRQMIVPQSSLWMAFLCCNFYTYSSFTLFIYDARYIAVVVAHSKKKPGYMRNIMDEPNTLKPPTRRAAPADAL